MAGRYNFQVDQGSVFDVSLTYKVGGTAIDLTGWTARMQVRATVDSSTVLLDLSTANDRIRVGSGGLIRLVLDDTDTAALDWQRGVYDLELTNPTGDTLPKLLRGYVLVRPEVTR